MSEDKKDSKKPRVKNKRKFRHNPCVHSYAYCYYNAKEHENVYRCVNCGKWLYC